MPSTLHPSASWITVAAVAIVFVIVYPLVLAFLAHRRLGVSWKYFLYGALIFFLFQVISRVPAVFIIQRAIAPQLQASRTLLYLWLAVLALTAGLFEEIGRYIGYRWLMRREEKTWNKAVMYGLGHGGLESILLVGGASLLTLINVIILSSINLNLLPVSQRVQVAHQLATLAAQPIWLPLLGAWERLWTIPVHVALSVIVLQVFRRGNIAWLLLAILAHAVVDFVSIGVLQVLGPRKVSSSLVVELIVATFGVIALWVIWTLRDKPGTIVEAEVQPLPSAGS